MKIEITTSGQYLDGSFVPTEIEATSDDGQSYAITRDSDGSFCVNSVLHGDENPAFAGNLSFEQAWLGLAHAFGVIGQ